jgi:hypothetical protein
MRRIWPKTLKKVRAWSGASDKSLVNERTLEGPSHVQYNTGLDPGCVVVLPTAPFVAALNEFEIAVELSSDSANCYILAQRHRFEMKDKNKK